MSKKLILSDENIYQIEHDGAMIDFVCKSKLEQSGAFGVNLPQAMTLEVFDCPQDGLKEVFVDTSKREVVDGKKIYPIVVDGQVAICSSLMPSFVKFFAKPKYVSLR